LLRVLVVAVTLAAMVGADRLLQCFWLSRVYSEFGNFGIKMDRSPHPGNNFIRYAPDPWFDFRYHRDITIHLKYLNMITGEWGTYDLTTNNLGLRGPDLEVRKPPRTLRVIALGGSSTLGQGVQQHQTYVFQLANLLRGSFDGYGVEAVNAGVQGYSSRHGFLLYYRELRQLKPDLIIVAFDVNDGHQPYTVQEVRGWPLPSLFELRTEYWIPDLDCYMRDPWCTLERLKARPTSLTHRLDFLYQSGLYFTMRYAANAWNRWQERRQGKVSMWPAITGPLPAKGDNRRPKYCPKCKPSIRYGSGSGESL